MSPSRWLLSRAGLTFLLAAGALLSAEAPPLLAANYAHEISNKLNTTGRSVTIPVPVEDQGTILGEVLIRIEPDDSILVDKASLIERLQPIVNDEQRSRLAKLSDSASFIPIEAIADAGVSLSFDRGLQQLKVSLALDDRATSELSFARAPGAVDGTHLATPAELAGYVNVLTDIGHDWTDTSADDTSLRLDLEAVMRFGGIVLENRVAYDGDNDPFTCPHDALCTYSHTAGFKREGSRLVYDVPEYQARLSAGDTEAIALPLQRHADLLGLSIEKTARKLAPAENINARGSGSFEIARNARVEVLVNGASMQTFSLRPGFYNLRDLPIAMGSNEIDLVITTDDGETRRLSFTAYADASLLAAGKSEWHVGAGMPSYLMDGSRIYDGDVMMASGYLRYGLTDDITAEAQLQGDDEVIMGGFGATLGTPWGILGLRGAMSDSNAGSGAAADIIWSRTNFAGLTGEHNESLFLEAEWRSTGFHTPGEHLIDASGILYPEFNYWLRLSAAYSVPVYDNVTGTLSARYLFSDPERERLSMNTIPGDQYGFDLTLASALSATTSASLTAGYSNEVYLYQDGRTRNIDPEFHAGARISIRPDDATSLNGEYDTLGNEAALSAIRSVGAGVGRWDTSVTAIGTGADERGSLNASAGYYGNRGEVRVSHAADATRYGPGRTIDTRQRTSLRVGTAVAFADGEVAVGAPVRGGAFGIVKPHESLEGHDIITGSIDNVRAKADALGNGLVTDIPAYLPSAVAVDVADLPLGYSLGAGAFDTFAPYKAGYVLEVGSANSVSVYGTLVTADGEPVSLVAGTARPESAKGSPVAVFTNAAGRFGAEGLAPGRWIIEMPLDSGPVQYAVDVPDGTQGLVKVGTLMPVRGTAQ